ncbi:MAG: hypothetical protein ABI960_02680 [Candidatus Eisenbacteria bacterium]
MAALSPRDPARARATLARVAVLAAGLLVAAGAEPATRRVPEDFASLGAALSVSGVGDTVLAAPGTYAENIVLASGVTLRAGGPAGSAVIDAGGAGAAVEARNPASGTRIEGFRLTGGTGINDAGSTLGGDLGILGGTLEVRDCSFDGAHANFGGGSGAAGALVTFERCAWTGTTADFGGGHFQSGGVLQWRDVTASGTSAASGGALYVTGGAQVTVLGAGITSTSASGDGGGIHLDACVATLSNLRIDGANAGGVGGGLSIAAGGQVIASFCAFLDCTSGQGGGGFHVSCDAGSPGLAAARTPGLGALAPAITDCALLSITHGDVLLARGPAPAAGAVTGAGVVRISSSIIAGNQSGLACLDPRATLDVTCSDLYANGGVDLSGSCLPASAASNLAVDPRLCDLPGRTLGLCANSALLSPGCGDDFWGVGALACGACGPTPTRPTTWGLLKARYRR